jgi:hypothetical protein
MSLLTHSGDIEVYNINPDCICKSSPFLDNNKLEYRHWSLSFRFSSELKLGHYYMCAIFKLTQILNTCNKKISFCINDIYHLKNSF